MVEYQNGDYDYDYDPTEYTTKLRQTRLTPAIVLSQNSIPSIVWAEDGLVFGHMVDIEVWPNLQLIVADEALEHAEKVILDNLPYVVNPEPIPSSRELLLVDREEPSCFPRSKRLTLVEPPTMDFDDTVAGYTPEDIMLHPASFFQLDMGDEGRSMPLDDIPTDIRCPTQTAFLDAMIATMMDPPLGYYHRTFFNRLRTYTEYLVRSTIRERPYVLEGNCNKLNIECQAVVDSLRPENREWMEGFLNRDVRRLMWESLRYRREFLIALGRENEMKRFPLSKRPGNPAPVRREYLAALNNPTLAADAQARAARIGGGKFVPGRMASIREYSTSSNAVGGRQAHGLRPPVVYRALRSLLRR